MTISLPLETMTVEEKVQVMEMLWDDLCHDDKNITSPAWHEDVLMAGEENLKSGVDQVMDWEEAKKLINKAIE